MTYEQALGAIIISIGLIGFSSWYVWCVYTMFFRCARPREFFSEAYSTSGPFFVVHVVGFILVAAWALMVATS